MELLMEKQPLGKGPEVSRTMELGENEVSIRNEEKGALVIGILPAEEAFPCLEGWHSGLPGCHP